MGKKKRKEQKADRIIDGGIDSMVSTANSIGNIRNKVENSFPGVITSVLGTHRPALETEINPGD
jgi:phage-related protein